MVIIYAIRKSYTFNSEWVDVATFPSLNGYTGHGYITPGVKDADGQFISKLEGSKIKIKTATNATFTASTAPIYQSFFWFDRSAQSKLFGFEDGQLISSAVSTASPSYAVHARLGNLHLLTISTQLLRDLAMDASVNICQFSSNLAITTGSLMGWGYGVNANLNTGFIVKVTAPNNNTISISNPQYSKIEIVKDTYDSSNNGKIITSDGTGTVTAGSFITINLMWIDARTVENECIIKTGTTAFTSNDAFARHFNYKHINLIQMYGSLSLDDVNRNSNPHAVGVFSDKIPLPVTSPRWEGNDYTSIQTYQNARFGTALKFYAEFEKKDVNAVCVCDFDNDKTFTMPGITMPKTYFVTKNPSAMIVSEDVREYSCYENIQIVWFS